MRIGIDGRLWNESGVGRYVRNLVKELQIIDRKNEYVLFVKNSDRPQLTSVNWRIVDTNTRWHTIAEQLKIPSVLDKEKLDLVHFPYFSVPIFYNKPYVVTIHDLILHHHPSGEASTLPRVFYKSKLLAYKYIISQAAKKAKKILTVSNATKKEIIDDLGIDSEKITVTYEGIDEEIINSRVKKSPMKHPYFLYVGNAYPHKNLELLLETFDLILKENPHVRLELIGKQDYFYKKIEKMIKEMKLQTFVRIHNNVSDLALSGWYRNAVALVAPSLMEGFDLPALEAMGNSCLVLASDIPAHREICGNAALYFNPEDVLSMKAAMTRCFNDLPAGRQGLNHFSKKKQLGLDRAKEFSWEKLAKETLSVYESSAGLR